MRSNEKRRATKGGSEKDMKGAGDGRREALREVQGQGSETDPAKKGKLYGETRRGRENYANGSLYQHKRRPICFGKYRWFVEDG